MSIDDPEGMLDNIMPAQLASLGPANGLSTSDTSRLNVAYNVDGPQFTSTTTTTSIDGEDVSLDRVNYRKFYKEMMKSNSGYASAPTLGSVNVEGESSPGSDGSTIVASGLGPNVNVTGFNQGGQKMVDASPVVSDTPFPGDGSVSPNVTSVKIKNNTSIHGTSIPGLGPENPEAGG